MGQIPARRTVMENSDLLWVAALQFALEELGEELVIAEPLAAVIQRREEDILPLQQFQRLLPARPLSNGVAQRAAQTTQDARLQQEVPAISGQRRQHVLRQVIGNKAVFATDDKRISRAKVSLAAERRHLQASGPPFQLCMQGSKLFIAKIKPHQAIQEIGSLVTSKLQVFCTHLQQFMTSAVAGQWHWWPGTRGQREV